MSRTSFAALPSLNNLPILWQMEHGSLTGSVALARDLWIPIGGSRICSCPYCKGGLAFYDTLRFSPEKSTTWMVHWPALHKGDVKG